VARLLGMLEVESSVVMRASEEKIDWTLQRIKFSLLSPVLSRVRFLARAYLMAQAGRTAGRGAGRQPGE
jgi:hypothetical protein